jgi:hypothetical protein
LCRRLQSTCEQQQLDDNFLVNDGGATTIDARKGGLFFAQMLSPSKSKMGGLFWAQN